jgi:hypothetical protein
MSEREKERVRKRDGLSYSYPYAEHYDFSCSSKVYYIFLLESSYQAL